MIVQEEMVNWSESEHVLLSCYLLCYLNYFHDLFSPFFGLNISNFPFPIAIPIPIPNPSPCSPESRSQSLDKLWDGARM